jgi:DNA-binding NarL/FixJ family response regulator
METRPRILISAASEISRQGLLQLIGESAEFEIVGATGYRTLLSSIHDLHPEILLIEHAAENDPLLKRIMELDEPITVVLLTNDPPSMKLLRSGVRAILSRESVESEIIAALKAVAAGFVVLPGESVDLFSHSYADDQRPEYLEPLSPREIQVLKMLAAGLGNKEIAARLEISGHTVKFHIHSIFTKLQVSSRTEAVTSGLRLGLILL